MIYDSFIFFNEIDLLKIRLEIYKDKIDKFIICEADKTFSGNDKPYYYLENKSLFKEYEDKIIYVPVELDTEGYDLNYKPEYMDFSSAYFKIEYNHRQGLGVAYQDLEDDDIVLLGDLDEFPSFEAIDFYKSRAVREPMCCELAMFYYFINCKKTDFEFWWKGNAICRGKEAKRKNGQALRRERGDSPLIRNGGWHFSYLGGIEQIKKKIQAYAHQEFNNENVLNNESLLECLREGKDVLHRPGHSFSFVDLSIFPDYILSEFNKYPQFISQP
tara:strand:- start:100 stop:918 length:819 start_codon:yes stop_codon:yes gene_type:complete